MRITTQSDYALRVLTYAGLSGEGPVKIRNIARDYGISQSHLTKVVWKLAEAGFLETSRGRNGGLWLARPPEQINLGDVLRETEDAYNLVECFEAGKCCVIAPDCTARRMFREAMEAFFDVFAKYTLADLLTRRSGLMKRLALAG